MRLAEPFVGAIVEESQQARLGVRREVADLVEEQRSAFGFLDLPGHVADRTRKRTLAMTEQRARHEIARERRDN